MVLSAGEKWVPERAAPVANRKAKVRQMLSETLQIWKEPIPGGAAELIRFWLTRFIKVAFLFDALMPSIFVYRLVYENNHIRSFVYNQ